MQGAFLVILALLAVLVSRGYVPVQAPPGCQITWRDRVRVAITVYAIGCSSIGVAVIIGFKFAPDVTLFDRLLRGLTVVGISLAPLAIFALVAGALRVKRHLEPAF